VNLLVQGGSAIQLFKGLDTRQLKVSSDTTPNAAFDFKSVMNEKSYAPREYEAEVTQSRSDEKLNKQEMTSRKRPEVRDANNEGTSTRKMKSKETSQVDQKGETEKVSKDESTEESKELSAVKKLLKKLGMSDEEITQMMEMIPEEMVSELAALMQELPQLTDLTLDSTVALEELSSMIGGLDEIIEKISLELSQMQNVPTELLSTIENLEAKLETAQMNLESMSAEDFAQVLTEVEAEVTAETRQTTELTSEIEVLEVKVTETPVENTDAKVETPASDATKIAPIEEQATQESHDENSSDKSDQSSDQSSDQAQTVVQTNAELTPSQVDQSFNDMIKIENSLIKNAQPMELASGRVRLAQNVMDQVMTGTKFQLNPTENGQQIVLRLSPEDLGTVNLKISVEKGILMAEFNVENQIVKETLESNMSDLKQALEEKGFAIEGMEVSVGQDQSEQQGQFENNFFNQSNQRKYFFGLEEDLPDLESLNKSLAGLQSSFEYLG